MSAIQDAYNQIGADFSDVLRRFTSEKLIVRFAEKFLEDGSFEITDQFSPGYPNTEEGHVQYLDSPACTSRRTR